MEVKIIETGETKELTLFDHHTHLNWVADLMGNHDALPDRNSDGDYELNRSEFDWWDNLTNRYQVSDDWYCYLLSELEPEAADLLRQAVESISCDLENYPLELRQACNNRVAEELILNCPAEAIEDHHKIGRAINNGVSKAEILGLCDDYPETYVWLKNIL